MNIYEKEFFAVSSEEAIAKATEYFRVDAEKLKIRELDGTISVDGLKDRMCFIVAIEGMADKEPEAGPPRGDRDRDRGRGGDRDRGRGGDRDRGRGGRDGGRGGDRDRGRGGDRDRGRGGDRDRGRGRPPRGDKPEGVDHERFEGLAKDAADQVLDSGEAVLLDPMTSKERWVVHNFIKDVEGVSSESEGEGTSKQIRVFPE